MRLVHRLVPRSLQSEVGSLGKGGSSESEAGSFSAFTYISLPAFVPWSLRV